jgi:diguanylate cyclase (GGDEF)-like protein
MSPCPKSSLPNASTLMCSGRACSVYAQLDDVLEQNLHLEEEASQLRNALLKARSDLQGTRAGERRARHSAEHDGLTRLPNRMYFESCVKEAIAERGSNGKALALFFLDLDDFKHINDTHGHAAGDTVLKVVAARLSRAVRKDDVVCRLGGDEFAGLLRGLGHSEQLTQLAEKLVETVAAPCRIEAGKLTVRPSIGIAICPEHGSTGSELLAHADAAMYRAKRQQSGYAFFERSE